MKEEHMDFEANRSATWKDVEERKADKKGVGLFVCARAMIRSGAEVLDVVDGGDRAGSAQTDVKEMSIRRSFQQPVKGLHRFFHLCTEGLGRNG